VLCFNAGGCQSLSDSWLLSGSCTGSACLVCVTVCSLLVVGVSGPLCLLVLRVQVCVVLVLLAFQLQAMQGLWRWYRGGRFISCTYGHANGTLRAHCKWRQPSIDVLAQRQVVCSSIWGLHGCVLPCFAIMLVVTAQPVPTVGIAF
jgi:hypothetical protein